MNEDLKRQISDKLKRHVSDKLQRREQIRRIAREAIEKRRKGPDGGDSAAPVTVTPPKSPRPSPLKAASDIGDDK